MVRRLLTPLLVLLALLGLPSAALAASRLETFPLPSLQGNIDLRLAKLNRVNDLNATVLLPDGYDAQPTRRWPVLYLFSGLDDTDATWSDPASGDIARVAAGLPAIVVMPETGRSYVTDAWRGGTRRGVNWERYELDEVIPAIESRYRVLPGRANHAIGGISAGGYGAVLLAAELPSYFGAAVSMSGLLDLQTTQAESAVPFFSMLSYARLWGPFHGPYVQAHDPMQLLPNLASTRLWVGWGNGVLDPGRPFNFPEWLLGGIAESQARQDALRFVSAANVAGLDVTGSARTGAHSWPYWRRMLPRVINWGPFAPTRADDPRLNTSWTYRTMAPHGNAWSLGFQFTAPTTALETFTRRGQLLSATGTGTVKINPGAADDDASGNGTEPQCSFTATLPFQRTLPAGC